VRMTTVGSGWNWNFVTLIPVLYNCWQAFTIIHSLLDHSHLDPKHFVAPGSQLLALFSPEPLCCIFQTDLACVSYASWCHHHAAKVAIRKHFQIIWDGAFGCSFVLISFRQTCRYSSTHISNRDSPTF
jgi:hypothetical protein